MIDTTLKAYRKELAEESEEDLTIEYCSTHNYNDKATAINGIEISELKSKGYEPVISIQKGPNEGQLIIVELEKDTILGRTLIPVVFLKTWETGSELFNQYDYMESFAHNLFVDYCNPEF